MIDKSGSMSQNRRWAQSAKATGVLARACCKSSPEGIQVYFFGSPGIFSFFISHYVIEFPCLNYHRRIKNLQRRKECESSRRFIFKE